MTAQLIPFQYGEQAARVVTDAQGAPWFNASDVCAALAMANSRQALESHVDTDDVQKLDVIDSLGRTQRANHVNESGLYALILGSTKDEAKRFKRWVTSEVLPAIRKTGSYGLPTVTALPAAKHDEVAALLLIGEAVAKVPGVKPGMAMAATLTCIESNTGLLVAELRKALPAANEPAATLNATALGKLLGLSARKVNLRLAAAGLQLRNERDEWELTEAGQAWGEALPYSRNGHSGYQILWQSAVADLLKEAA